MKWERPQIICVWPAVRAIQGGQQKVRWPIVDSRVYPHYLSTPPAYEADE
ncbi:MAG TPA: hypothetical protein VJR04_12585 [Terriglobales bacterium]|nr:hypothetical protein [Terriglobales bacterium]